MVQCTIRQPELQCQTARGFLRVGCFGIGASQGEACYDVQALARKQRGTRVNCSLRVSHESSTRAYTFGMVAALASMSAVGPLQSIDDFLGRGLGRILGSLQIERSAGFVGCAVGRWAR